MIKCGTSALVIFHRNELWRKFMNSRLTLYIYMYNMYVCTNTYSTVYILRLKMICVVVVCFEREEWKKKCWNKVQWRNHLWVLTGNGRSGEKRGKWKHSVAFFLLYFIFSLYTYIIFLLLLLFLFFSFSRADFCRFDILILAHKLTLRCDGESEREREKKKNFTMYFNSFAFICIIIWYNFYYARLGFVRVCVWVYREIE